MELQEFIYLEFDIKFRVETESILNEIDVSVGDILKTAMCSEVDENGLQFNYNRSTMCEDIPCVTHSLYLVATSDFKKVIETCRSGAFKKHHDQFFGKLEKLWNLSNGTLKPLNLSMNISVIRF